MNFLTPFRERLWHMFSPGQPSPTTPKPPSPRTEPLHRVHKDLAEKFPTRRRSLSPTVKRSQRAKEDDDPGFTYEEDDFDESDGSQYESNEEEEEKEEETEDGEPQSKRIKRSKDYTADGDFESEEGEEEQVADITAEEKDEYGIGITIEPVAHATLEDPEYEGWTQDELNLYNRLNDRGVIPLLPSSWSLDFPTIPEVLFTNDPEEAYIKREEGTEFRATKALSNLLSAGVRARDTSSVAHKNPAPTLSSTIKSYITWSLKDVGLNEKSITPLISVMAAPRTEAIQKTVTRMTTELQGLAAQWREIWAETQSANDSPEVTMTNGTPTSSSRKRKRESHSETPTPASKQRERERASSTTAEEPLPTLYGIVIARTIMAFVTYDAALEESNVRNLALFNWRDQGQDVWNALAVALMVVQAREVLLAIGAHAGRGRKLSQGDPDA